MATASRPPAGSGATPSPAGRPSEVSRPRGRNTLGRVFAAGAVGAVLLVLGLLIFDTGGGGTEYRLLFNSADQLVRGDEVQVGGVTVGTVKSITLTKSFKARITIEIENRLAPLHQGTTAEVRVPSLTVVADRYISLAPGPNSSPAIAAGATLPVKDTSEAVNLDEVFDIFNHKTRKGLQHVIEGFAAQYEGTGKAVHTATPYFNPALRATNHIFEEVLHEEKTFSRFLVNAAKATSTIGAHGKQLGGLIRNASSMFEAIGSQQASFAAGLHELPQTFKEGKQAFAELPEMLADLRRLARVSKPNTKTLPEFFNRLRPLLSKATPVVSELSAAISRPGANNDLTEFALGLPGLAKSLRTASPNGVKASQQSVPITAFFGPYSPDLQGLFRDFGLEAGYYDGDGHYVRVSPDFANFKLASAGKLVPVNPQQGLEGLKTGQLSRCPGAGTQPAADGSSPYTDEGKLGCDETETP